MNLLLGRLLNGIPSIMYLAFSGSRQRGILTDAQYNTGLFVPGCFPDGDLRDLAYGQWLLVAVLMNDEPGLVIVYDVIIVPFIVDLQPSCVAAAVVGELSHVNAIGIFENNAVGITGILHKIHQVLLAKLYSY